MFEAEDLSLKLVLEIMTLVSSVNIILTKRYLLWEKGHLTIVQKVRFLELTFWELIQFCV
jgi:hypothetical protein